MRKLTGAFALAASAVGAPVAAQVSVPGPEPREVVTRGPKVTQPPEIKRVSDGELAKTYFYVGGEFGAMIVEDIDVDVGATSNAITLDHEYGVDGGLFAGYDFGGFRLEAEAAYKKADLETYYTTIRLPLEGTSFPSSRAASGSSTALSFMINGMLDFGDDDGLSGFVGAGVGMAQVKANNYRNFANATPFLDGSDWKRAWQVFAGVRQAVTDNIDVTLKYRFFNADSARLIAFNGAESDLRFRSHSILGGVTLKFRKPKPPVDEPYCPSGWMMNAGQCERDGPPVTHWECPPDTTPHATKPQCVGPVYGPYIVFFDWDQPRPETPAELRLSDETKAKLDAVAEKYTRTGQAQLTIEAHTDSSGSDKWNEGLGKRRLDAVRAYLAEKGVPAPPAEPLGESYGERCQRVETANGVKELQNRRVELFFGPRPHTLPPNCPPVQADFQMD